MQSEQAVSFIQMDKIVPSPYQPRKTWDENELHDMAASIRRHGVLQPIMLRRVGGLFELVSGERRLRAAYMAGLRVIPALIAQVDDKQSAVLALIENVQHRDLRYMEEAQAYQNLVDKHHMTPEEIAQAMGKSPSFVAEKLQILQLSPGVQQVLEEYELTENHAKALLRLPQGACQLDAVLHIARAGLNTRESEAYIETILANGEEFGLYYGVPCIKTALATDDMANNQEERPYSRKEESLCYAQKNQEPEKVIWLDETKAEDLVEIEGEKAEEKPKENKQRIRHFIHDIHLFTNTVKKAALYMSDAGVPVQVAENKQEGYYEMVIRVPYQ